MTEVCFLGTGGAVPTQDKDNTSFVLKHKEIQVLVDCPGGVIQKIKRLSLDPCKTTSIVITHIHPDHVYGLPSLVHSLMLDECLIPLYGSKETVDLCRNLLDLFDLQNEKIMTRLDFISLKPGQKFKMTDVLSCNSLEVPHSSSSLAFHFHFKDSQKELIYSGDTPVNSNLFSKASGVDYLIHDCSAPSRFFKKYPSLYEMHTNSLQLGEFAQNAGIKCLIPCHFFGEFNFSLEEIENEIRENFQGHLILPKDFERIAL
jgi:ribonuclease Z